MQARVSREGEVVVVHLLGRIDAESADGFRKICLEKFATSQVVFNFAGLSFVGSSGILPFLETMQVFKQANQCGVRFSSVGTEFKRLFAATPLHDILIYENFQLASRAFNDETVPSIPHEQAVTAENLISFESLFSAADLSIDESAIDQLATESNDEESSTEI
jgi:anti-anti-sigma factor